jgi:hypothetical protein
MMTETYIRNRRGKKVSPTRCIAERGLFLRSGANR